jgi:protein-tyrosine phosphatase/nicotinamidase-related amidase
MAKSVLITQCLQNDFVKPIGKYDPVPNLLHVGYEESKRLMGLNPAEGPVANTIRWAYAQSEEDLEIIHIRDWHDREDTSQQGHLEVFGEHCIMLTEGSRFAFHLDSYPRQALIVDSLSLNDFLDTELPDLLDQYKEERVRIGIMGVWTEAKVSFLAYDLVTRYPNFKVAVCSALTAGSTILSHYSALDHLQKILGVHVINSIGEFTKFIMGTDAGFDLHAPGKEDFPELVFNEEANVSEADDKIIRYLYRNARKVDLSVLDGGYSGNLVLKSKSTDEEGREEAPHVVKIGPQGPIGQERMSFERVEGVLGNSAPRIVDFVDYQERGAIKYRYASMGKGSSTTLQKLFDKGISIHKFKYYLDQVFEDQLGKFYRARTFEKSNLLDYYMFDPGRAERLKPKIEKVLGKPADKAVLALPTGHEFPNPYTFTRDELEELMNKNMRSHFFSYVHGDLNGANIMIDGQDNVWLIDFFHTHMGHVLRDLIKLENDLLYIYTPMNNEDDLNEALLFSSLLFEVRDLAKPLKPVEETGLTKPGFIRTYEALQVLRSYYPALIEYDRDPLQLLIAQLRYSLHTLSFLESNNLHKLWALYNSGHFGQKIKKRITSGGKIRIDWINHELIPSGSLGMTLLPGRRDYSRSLDEDLKEIKELGVEVIVPLLTDDELDHFGVLDLIDSYLESGFMVYRLPILDQLVSSEKEMKELVDQLDTFLGMNKKVMVHCVGGLGRSGMVGAAYLKYKGLSAKESIEIIRATRSPRAVESKEQEDFVRAIKF